jgi:hypothetical protein
MVDSEYLEQRFGGYMPYRILAEADRDHRDQRTDFGHWESG